MDKFTEMLDYLHRNPDVVYYANELIAELKLFRDDKEHQEVIDYIQEGGGGIWYCSDCQATRQVNRPCFCSEKKTKAEILRMGNVISVKVRGVVRIAEVVGSGCSSNGSSWITLLLDNGERIDVQDKKTIEVYINLDSDEED